MQVALKVEWHPSGVVPEVWSGTITKVANCSVSLVEYYLNQSPPPDECFPGDTYDIPAHLVFSPDEPIFYPKVWVHLGNSRGFETCMGSIPLPIWVGVGVGNSNPHTPCKPIHQDKLVSL